MIDCEGPILVDEAGGVNATTAAAANPGRNQLTGRACAMACVRACVPGINWHLDVMKPVCGTRLMPPPDDVVPPPASLALLL